MIRTRLIVAFSALVLLALAQLGFTWWATRAASIQSEMSVVAARMLTEYLDFGANKQRLKVWFAQSMLTRENEPANRVLLTERMKASLTKLDDAINKWQAIEESASNSAGEAIALERATVTLLRTNFVALLPLLDSATPLASDTDKSAAWRNAISVFDESEGRDMRSLLADAVERQRNFNARSVVELEKQIKQIRNAALLLTISVCIIGALAMVYFVAKIQRPMTRVVERTNAIADGDYAAIDATQTRDEFGRIERALNSMRARLAEARVRDQTIQVALERMVDERTRALTESYEKLMDQDGQRRHFFADIGHELRTPITVIRGEAEIALRGGDRDAASYRDSLQRIVAASESLTQRSNELIQLARTGWGDHTFEYEKQALEPIVRSSVDQALGLALPRKIRVEYRADDELAAATIRCDRPRFEQVMMIVLDNAIRYSPDESIVQVTATMRNTAISIEVADHGIGFSESERRQVFERYFRGERARILRADGMGLGLAIARTIVNAHGGDIRIENNTPSGARVIIDIPPYAPLDS